MKFKIQCMQGPSWTDYEPGNYYETAVAAEQAMTQFMEMHGLTFRVVPF